MLTLKDRAAVVLAEAWQKLPPAKHEVVIDRIVLADLQAKHGSWSPEKQQLALSTRLLSGPPDFLPMIDIDGQTPPMRLPFCSRALHTAIHELAHAIGSTTGLDFSWQWRALSGWVEDDNNPINTARYMELRPGWPHIISEWRHDVGTCFVRDYSRRSPAEDFADALTHVCLGWMDFAVQSHPYRESGLAKLAFLRRSLWGETGARAVAAACQRWQARLASLVMGGRLC